MNAHCEWIRENGLHFQIQVRKPFLDMISLIFLSTQHGNGRLALKLILDELGQLDRRFVHEFELRVSRKSLFRNCRASQPCSWSRENPVFIISCSTTGRCLAPWNPRDRIRAREYAPLVSVQESTETLIAVPSTVHMPDGLDFGTSQIQDVRLTQTFII